LVITVGGDGTFLATAQRVGDAVMLGVNSAPGSSVGHYCGTDSEGFEAALEELLAGQAPITRLGRIEMEIGTRRCPLLALNDVLFANRSPACASRYLLRVADAQSFQISSGIWVSTASGSSGAMHSAGGVVMEPGDHRLQFRVREPYGETLAADALTQGLTDSPIVVVPRTPNHMIYLDGQLRAYRVGFGSKVSFRLSDTPLRLARYRP
jgi:NAD+ kinase